MKRFTRLSLNLTPAPSPKEREKANPARILGIPVIF